MSTHLAGVPTGKIIRGISSAAERWSDADFPPRVRALDRIVARTGYSIPVVEYALDRLFFSVTERDLQAVVRSELGSLDALDGFVAREGRPHAWAAPAGRVCVISSRTTIGVALVPAIFALCAKCDVLVKDREDSLGAAFFDSLREELDEFEGAARASAWTPGSESAPDLAGFDAIVAFGSDDTLHAIARQVRAGARFIGYGSRASAGYVGRDALADERSAKAIAEGAARDLVLYESEGCLSLHVLFVESGGALSPEQFMTTLAQQVERTNIEFPFGRRDPALAARVAQHRNLAAFRAASGSGHVFSGDDAEYVLQLNPPRSEAPAFLPRTLGVYVVDGPAEAASYLAAHNMPLEGFAIAGARPELAEMAAHSGAVRLTRFGELQHPPLGGDHGGRPRIAEFVKWIDRTL